MDDFCSRALPYIKPDVGDNGEPALALSHDDSPVMRELGNGLLVLYAVDQETHLEMVLHRHLSAAGLDPGKLHQQAMSNLYDYIDSKVMLHPFGRCHGLSLDGNFEASLLLADTLWDQSLAAYTPGGCVVAVPARDVVAFADAGAPDAIDELRGVIDRVWASGDHLISTDLYRRARGGWVRIDG